MLPFHNKIKLISGDIHQVKLLASSSLFTSYFYLSSSSLAERSATRAAGALTSWWLLASPMVFMPLFVSSFRFGCGETLILCASSHSKGSALIDSPRLWLFYAFLRHVPPRGVGEWTIKTSQQVLMRNYGMKTNNSTLHAHVHAPHLFISSRCH